MAWLVGFDIEEPTEAWRKGGRRYNDGGVQSGGGARRSSGRRRFLCVSCCSIPTFCAIRLVPTDSVVHTTNSQDKKPRNSFPLLSVKPVPGSMHAHTPLRKKRNYGGRWALIVVTSYNHCCCSKSQEKRY